MHFESFAMLIGGLGLFFGGMHMLSSNLKQLISRKFKLFISRVADNGITAGIWGTLLGLITQSSSVVTVIVASLMSGDLLTIRKSLPIIFWANAGCSILLVIAILDIQYVVLLLLGLSGICYTIEKLARFHHALGALFGLSLLFFGLSTIRSAGPFAGPAGLESLLLILKDYYFLVFVLGCVLLLISQTATGTIIIAITMTNAGIFTMDQTLMLIYGVYAGSGITTFVLLSNLKGSAKQAVMAKVLFSIFGVAIFVGMFYIELYTNIPLVKAFVGLLSDDIARQAVLVALLFNFSIAFILSFLLTPCARILNHFCPPLEEEALSKIKFIHAYAADDPETAILLIEKEIFRLLKRIPLYLDRLRPEITEETVELYNYHNAFGEVSSEIQLLVTDVFQKDLNFSTSETLLNVQNRHILVTTLEDIVYGLCKMLEGKNEEGEQKKLAMTIIESLDALLLTAIETTKSADAFDLDILINLTSDKGKVMERIRRAYLSSEKELSPEDRSLIIHLTTLFERSVWTLGRYGMYLVQNAAGQERPAQGDFL